MDRKTFLQMCAFGALRFSFGIGASCAVPVDAQTEKKSKGRVIACLVEPESKTNTLRIIDWDNYKNTDYAVPLGLPHSLIQDRTDANTVYIFEVFGSCLKINLRTKEMVKIDHSNSNSMFNGHGILTRTGDHLLCTQISRELAAVVLVIRSSQTLEQIAIAPKECGQAHHVVALPGADSAACGNTRGIDGEISGGITFYDYQKNTILKRIDFELPVLHLLPISSSEVIGVTFHVEPHDETHGKPGELLAKERKNDQRQDQRIGISYQNKSKENLRVFNDGEVHLPGPLYYANLNGDKKIFWDEKQKPFFQYGFGLAKIPQEQTRKFLVGYRQSGKVLLFENEKILRIFDVPDPTNIVVSPDGTEFMVASPNHLRVFSLKTGQEIKSIFDPRPLSMISSYA